MNLCRKEKRKFWHFLFEIHICFFFVKLEIMSERLSGWEGNNSVCLSWSSSGCTRSPSGWPSGDLPSVAVAFSGGPLGQQDAARRCQSPRRSAHLRVPAGDEEHGGQSSGQLAQRWGRRLCCVVPPALLFGTRLYCGGFSFLSSWENNKTFFSWNVNIFYRNTVQEELSLSQQFFFSSPNTGCVSACFPWLGAAH